MFLSKYLLLLNLEKSKESVLLFWDMQNVGREREHDHSLHCVDIIHFSGILADTSRCLIDCAVLPQQTRTKGKKKVLTIMLQILGVKYCWEIIFGKAVFSLELNIKMWFPFFHDCGTSSILCDVWGPGSGCGIGRTRSLW